MPESVAGWSSKTWTFMSGQSCSCVPAAETRTQPRNYISIHHFTVYVARGPEVSRVLSITELFGLRLSVESYVAQKSPAIKCCERFGHTQRNCRYAHPGASLWWRSPHRWVIIPGVKPAGQLHSV